MDFVIRFHFLLIYERNKDKVSNIDINSSFSLIFPRTGACKSGQMILRKMTVSDRKELF